jgi:hypothetical protein
LVHTLHITNGDSTTGSLRESGLDGEIISWREALVAGPTPAGAEGEEWLAIRARFLAHDYGVDEMKCLRELREQEQVLEMLDSFEEVTLWFEHDLFCQANLLHLLARIHESRHQSVRLTLVAIDTFPGIEHFHGLGELSPSQLAGLFETRTPIAPAQLALGAEGWSAYRAADPTAIEALLARDTSTLPFMRAAFERHLARFPSTHNGLGAIEQRALALIDAGARKFGALFSRFNNAASDYGYGDFQLWRDLEPMAACAHPLITIDGVARDAQPLSSGAFGDAAFEITDTGRAILAGDEDAVRLNGIDRWLGGVHLQSDRHVWRWNAEDRAVE